MLIMLSMLYDGQECRSIVNMFLSWGISWGSFFNHYFVKYAHYAGYVFRLFCTLTLHLISQNIPRILSISYEKQSVLIYPIYRVYLCSLRTLFTSAYTLYTECISVSEPAALRNSNMPNKWGIFMSIFAAFSEVRTHAEVRCIH